MFLHNDKHHDPQAAQWVYRLMHDTEYYEKWFYKDVIDDYVMIINECQKVYDKTPVTNRLTRAKCLSTIRGAKRDLAKVQVKYNKYLEHKARTAISK